jgi:spore germination protein YaaH
MREFKANKTLVFGIWIALILAALIFGKYVFRPKIDLKVAVSKYHFDSSIGSHPSVYFCFELAADKVLLNQNCSFKNLNKIHCGLQNEHLGQWNLKFMTEKPELLATKALKLLKKHNCQDVVIDIEGLKLDVAIKLNSWIEIFVKKLKEDLPVFFASYAKSMKISTNVTANAQNYEFICNNFNEIWIMAYDRHIPPYTKIGEIAPLEWVRKVTQYAMTKCQSNQIRIGLAAYGYDWKN